MNIYLSNIYLTAIDNKYTTWYIQLCQSRFAYARNKKLANLIHGYTESHHIWPEAFCKGEKGEYDILNRVHFTPREHFVAHWLLSKMFKERSKYWFSMQDGFGAMTGTRKKRNLSSNRYERARLTYIKSITGKKQSPETIEKRMKFVRGVKHTPEHRRNNALARLGKKRSPETIEAVAASRRGLSFSFPVVKCPHCDKSGGSNLMHRYHFDNCKFLSIRNIS